MNTKLLTSAGCLLLLAAAIAPSVLGHSENDYKYFPENVLGVTGLYVGSAGAASADETNYANTISGGAMLCDLEVAGDGTTHSAQDELRVDDGNTAGVLNPHAAEEGSPGYPPNDGSPDAGTLEDTWDDGGQGGACHVRTYVHGDYNTFGCPAATAHAINEIDYNAGETVTDTFLGASCDWKFSTGGTGATTTFQLCVINNAIQGQAANIPGCIITWINCMGNPTGCTIGGTEGCGSDGSSDGINYGHGSIGVPYPTAAAHQGNFGLDADRDQDGTNEADCASSDATAQVFMFDAVNTNHLEIAGGSPAVHPALTGQIWQV